MVYDPQEDSYLLADIVKKRVTNDMRVLDVGTGSGIQAVTAVEAGARTVVAVDIDQEALDQVMSVVKEKGYANLRVQHSDLFSSIGKNDLFDVIIFNAPYLPSDKRDPDLALDGGIEGHELIARFLGEAKNYLLPGGEVLLLFSTQSGFEQVLKAITDHEYVAEELGELPMFFERLYVYSLTRPR